MASRSERTRQSADEMHPLNGHLGVVPRMKSRESFIKCTEPHQHDGESCSHGVMESPWTSVCPLTSVLTNTFQLVRRTPHPRTTWKALNRLRTQVGRARVNMPKWRYSNETDTCDCGIRQTMQHLLVCPMMSTARSIQDLITANGILIGRARH